MTIYSDERPVLREQSDSSYSQDDRCTTYLRSLFLAFDRSTTFGSWSKYVVLCITLQIVMRFRVQLRRHVTYSNNNISMEHYMFDSSFVIAIIVKMLNFLIIHK